MRNEVTPLRSFPTLGTASWVSQKGHILRPGLWSFSAMPGTILHAQLLTGWGKQFSRYEFPGQSSPVRTLPSTFPWVPDAIASVCVGGLDWWPPQPKDPFHTPQPSSLLKGVRAESRAVPAASCPQRDQCLRQKESAKTQGPLLPHLWALCSEPAP